MRQILLLSFTLLCHTLVKATVDTEQASQYDNVNTVEKNCTDGCKGIAGVRAFIVDEEAEPRIVGGSEAWPHSWPWQVVLSFFDMPACGGAIVSPQWVLTAAHCFKRHKKESFWMVLAGKHDLDNETESCQQTANVSKIITHKDYNSVTKEHDLALVKLKSQLQFDECVRPVSVWDGPLSTLAQCTITGWGSTTENGPHATRLQEVNVTVLDSDICLQYYRGAFYPSMLCAGELNGRADACQGDSGGPLSCFTDERYKVAGIVSWGVGCGRARKPGVFTKVTLYNQWINSTMYGQPATDDTRKNFTEKCGHAEVAPCGLGHELLGLEPSISNKPILENVSEACPHSWPWQVSIQSGGIHYCSGTLIHQQWVLASRHCRIKAGDNVVLGAHDLNLAESQSVTVKEVYSQRYDGSFPPRHDLSLLYLSVPAQLGISVFPVCVADNEMQLGSSCVTTGWGYESPTLEKSGDVLYQVQVAPLKEEACWSGWGQVFSSGSLLCTDAVASPSCMGDNGAPLLCKQNDLYYLVGMMTWGSKKCDSKKPAVFTRVSDFQSWIESILNEKLF